MTLVYKVFIGLQEDQCVMRDIASQLTAGSKRWVSQISLPLDELDNHLEPPSRHLLTQVLADYPGTLLLVFHDPEFVAGGGLKGSIDWRGD